MGDCLVINFSHIDTAIELSPKTVQQSTVRFNAFFICVQIMLQIIRQSVFVSAFTLRLTDAIFCQLLHGNTKRLRKFINGFGRAFFKFSFPLQISLRVGCGIPACIASLYFVMPRWASKDSITIIFASLSTLYRYAEIMARVNYKVL